MDPAGVLRASARATALILELAGGVADPAPSAVGRLPEPSPNVPLRLERCEALLGVAVPPERVDQILTGFGLEKREGGWKVPSFRPDLTREIDLIEEIARVIGIEAVPAREQARFASLSEADRRHDQAMRVRTRLAGRGYREARSLTLLSEKTLALFPVEPVLRVRNPLGEDQVILRPSLLPGLLQAVAHNIRGGTRDLRLFEVGRIFRADVREERSALALVLTGAAVPSSWRTPKPRQADFFDLKGDLEFLLRSLCGREPGGACFQPTSHPALALAVEIRCGDTVLGVAGQLFPARARELDAAAPVLVAELDLGLFPAAPAGNRFTPLPRFPAVTRDIALIAPLGLPHGAVEAALRAAEEPLLAGVELFDVFTDPTGEKIPADRKSLAYALTYRSLERTLTAEEVTQAHTRLKDRLKGDLEVSFRE